MISKGVSQEELNTTLNQGLKGSTDSFGVKAKIRELAKSRNAEPVVTPEPVVSPKPVSESTPASVAGPAVESVPANEPADIPEFQPDPRITEYVELSGLTDQEFRALMEPYESVFQQALEKARSLAVGEIRLRDLDLRKLRRTLSETQTLRELNSFQIRLLDKIDQLVIDENRGKYRGYLEDAILEDRNSESDLYEILYIIKRRARDKNFNVEDFLTYQGKGYYHQGTIDEARRIFKNTYIVLNTVKSAYNENLFAEMYRRGKRGFRVAGNNSSNSFEVLEGIYKQSFDNMLALAERESERQRQVEKTTTVQENTVPRPKQPVAEPVVEPEAEPVAEANAIVDTEINRSRQLPPEYQIPELVRFRKLQNLTDQEFLDQCQEIEATFGRVRIEALEQVINSQVLEDFDLIYLNRNLKDNSIYSELSSSQRETLQRIDSLIEKNIYGNELIDRINADNKINRELREILGLLKSEAKRNNLELRDFLIKKSGEYFSQDLEDKTKFLFRNKYQNLITQDFNNMDSVALFAERVRREKTGLRTTNTSFESCPEIYEQAAAQIDYMEGLEDKAELDDKEFVSEYLKLSKYTKEQRDSMKNLVLPRILSEINKELNNPDSLKKNPDGTLSAETCKEIADKAIPLERLSILLFLTNSARTDVLTDYQKAVLYYNMLNTAEKINKLRTQIMSQFKR